MRLLHCADLHLSQAERAYSFSVLEEILGTAVRERAAVLLLAGDTFDSWTDMESLRVPFRDRLLATVTANPALRVIILPGNHESLRAPSGTTMDRLDFGQATEPRVFLVPRATEGTPFTRIELDGGTELLALAPRERWDDYRNWQVPPKGQGVRIVMAHASVSGFTYLGPAEENQAGVIDTDLFTFLQADYAALGHIHAGTVKRVDRTTVAYPGSARVWRAGETGRHRVLVVDTAGGTAGVEVRPVTLAAAGEFRRIEVPLGLDGRLPPPQDILAGCGADDLVTFVLTGAVEDEELAAKAAAEIDTAAQDRVRDWQVERDGILVFSEVSTNRLARRFIERWAALEPADGDSPEAQKARSVWSRARIVGLAKIKDTLRARK